MYFEYSYILVSSLTQTAHVTDKAGEYTFISFFLLHSWMLTLHELCTHQRIIVKLLLCTNWDFPAH